MLLKTVQAFVPDFPKLEMGEPATRATRMLNWFTSIEQSVNPAGPHLIQWWQWCRQEAQGAYDIFLAAPTHQRESIMPAAPTPMAWLQIEAWIRPRVLEALPKDIKEWVNMRARQGKLDAVQVLLFYLMKSFSPGARRKRYTLLPQSSTPIAARNLAQHKWSS